MQPITADGINAMSNSASPARRALSLPHILEHIISHVDPADLPSCATVDRAWFEVAATRLYRQVEVKRNNADGGLILPWAMRYHWRKDGLGGTSLNTGGPPAVLWARTVAFGTVKHIILHAHDHGRCRGRYMPPETMSPDQLTRRQGIYEEDADPAESLREEASKMGVEERQEMAVDTLEIYVASVNAARRCEFIRHIKPATLIIRQVPAAGRVEEDEDHVPPSSVTAPAPRTAILDLPAACLATRYTTHVAMPFFPESTHHIIYLPYIFSPSVHSIGDESTIDAVARPYTMINWLRRRLPQCSARTKFTIVNLDRLGPVVDIFRIGGDREPRTFVGILEDLYNSSAVKAGKPRYDTLDVTFLTQEQFDRTPDARLIDINARLATVKPLRPTGRLSRAGGHGFVG